MNKEKSDSNSSGYLSASKVAEELGISLSTLYSYVSRGLLRSEVADNGKRTRRYRVEDVQRLKERQEMRRDPQKVVDSSLHWGTPMLSSALTLIEGGKFFYRGQDAAELAQHSAIEKVASLFWQGDEETETIFTAPLPALTPQIRAVLPALHELSPLERMQAVLPLLAANDLAAYDFRPAQVSQTGSRILRRMTLLALNQGEADGGGGIAQTLQRIWAPDDPSSQSLFNAALILCADHELNVSSFTARCVASAGSTPYAVVNAGLSALQGVKHGGMSGRVEALFREVGQPSKASSTIAQRLRRGDPIPGFGHRLYPDGDPRGRLLIDLVKGAFPNSAAVELASSIEEVAQAILNERPSIDFGLATLCAALELPAGSAITLFALGRTIGWIGHAIEEYQANQLIRPRAHYTGVLPNAA